MGVWGEFMNIRNWVRLFLHTFVLGGLVTVVTGFAVQWGKYKALFVSFDVLEILSITIWLVGVGFIFSAISQMGYFAYLTVHRFGLGFFRSLWNPVQAVIIAFVLFDFVYFRYKQFAGVNDSIGPYLLFALFLLLIGLSIAYIKSQQTNRHAFIPALFFMVCITIIEWFPVLRVNDQDWFHLMLYPLLICNAYQLLMLPKYIERSKVEKQNTSKTSEFLTGK